MSQPIRVLVVEDRPSDAELVIRELRHAGLEPQWERVQTEADFLAALDTSPDLILSDFAMPQFDGFRALELLRASGRDIPFILISGTLGEEAAVEAMKRGAADYLLKDRTARLGHAVQRALEDKRLRDERQRAEEALRASEEYARNIIRSSLDMIVAVDRERKITEFNEAAQRTFGYAREEVLGHPVDLLYANPEEGLFVNKTTIEEGRCVQEIQNRRKNGEVFTSLLSSSLLQDLQGEIVGRMGISRDITDRKRAEEDLRNSEALYQSLVETLPQYIFRKDLAGRFTFANQRFCETLGQSVHEIVGTTDFDYFPPNLAAKYQRDDRGVISTGQIFEAVEENEVPGGQKRYVQVVKIPLRDTAGRIFGLQGIFWDITDRRRAEAALLEAERNYRNIVENAIEGIFQTTPEGRYVTVNPALVRIYGYESPDELIAATTDIARKLYVDPNRRAEFNLELAQNNAAFNFEARVYRKDGSIIWISENVRSVRDESGRVLRYDGTTQDITDRKRAEEALRETEERYRKLVELSPDAIYIHCQGKLVLANRAAVVLFGAADANELLGHNVLELIHPDSRALMEERMRKLQETNATLPVAEKKLLRLDGSSFDADVSTAPFMFQGKPSALEIVRDITERKALNEKLLRNQRLESIGTLAGGIAHDLNNVLAPILMSIEILRLKYPETEAEHILATIESSAQRGADLVKQVLTFSRGLQGERTPVQLRHVIREMQSIIRQTFPKAITLRTEMPRDIWSVNGDVTQLHQVLMNLCVNARDAMPDGGTLGIKTEHLTLDEAFARMNPEARVGPYVVLTVTDTGTGMPPEIRERIFEPFFTTKEQGKGTGLGLATVLGIAKGHGGFVTVYSEVGRGTKFKVYLPAQPSAETQRADSERPPLPMGHGELILVADDEVAIQRIVQETLQMCGYTVVTVSNGAEAVAVCAQRAQELKLVITDMMMPIMDVPATVHALRVLAPNVKIIAASGLGSGVRETDPQKLGVDAFLRKPFTAETLLRTVGEVLGKG